MSDLIESENTQTVTNDTPAHFLSEFVYKKEGVFCVSPEQASHFAKHLAKDFNPIHNSNAKRFCVPGDLLFALTLQECGLHTHMEFDFNGMVGRNASLIIEQNSEAPDQTFIQIVDEQSKQYVAAKAGGASTNNASTIEAFIRAYVAFSGQSFPDVLIPLLAEQDVMINPDRPLVMYQSMSLTLHHCDVENVTLRARRPQLEQDGKRGKVIFPFEFVSVSGDTESVIGQGEKSMVVSGLRPYDATRMEELREEYLSWKRNYTQ